MGCGVEGGWEGGGGLVGVGAGEDVQEGGGEGVVVCGGEVGGEDVARAAVDDEAGGGWGRGVFHFGHCGGCEVDEVTKEEVGVRGGYMMDIRYI